MYLVDHINPLTSTSTNFINHTSQEHEHTTTTLEPLMADSLSTLLIRRSTNHLFPLSKGYVVLVMCMCGTIFAVTFYMCAWVHRRNAEEREKIEALRAVIRSRMQTAEAEAMARQVEEDRIQGLATFESRVGEPNPS